MWNESYRQLMIHKFDTLTDLKRVLGDTRQPIVHGASGPRVDHNLSYFIRLAELCRPVRFHDAHQSWNTQNVLSNLHSDKLLQKECGSYCTKVVPIKTNCTCWPPGIMWPTSWTVRAEFLSSVFTLITLWLSPPMDRMALAGSGAPRAPGLEGRQKSVCLINIILIV